MSSETSLDLLASFVALAGDLHYTRAAERLHVAQPALTKRIQQLERAIGTALFARTRRAVSLTPAGELLLPRARQVLQAAAEFSTAARRVSDGEVGRLRIGFSPSAPHLVLPALMRAFRKRHPSIDCVLTELPSEAQVEQILGGDLRSRHPPAAHSPSGTPAVHDVFRGALCRRSAARPPPGGPARAAAP